jgi:hypothetical protein
MSGLDPDPVRAPGDGAAGSTRANARETGSAANIGEIIGEVSKDFTTLLRQEVELAKAEVTKSAKEAGVGAGLYGGAGFAVYFSVLFVCLALWWWVGSAIGLGWSALIGAVVWAIIAAVLAARAKRSLSNVTGMRQTAETARQIPDALKGKDNQQ